MEKLKPCPFCGSEVIYITTDYGYSNDTVAIFCNTCKTVVKLEENDEEGVNEKTTEKAVRAWNKRFGSILEQLNIDIEELAERIRQSVGEITLLDPKSLEPHIEPLDCKNVDWIPVTERLPKEKGRYLVTLELVDTDGTLNDCVTVRIFWGDQWNVLSFEHVVAWQPLPKSYKGVE